MISRKERIQREKKLSSIRYNIEEVLSEVATILLRGVALGIILTIIYVLSVFYNIYFKTLLSSVFN